MSSKGGDTKIASGVLGRVGSQQLIRLRCEDEIALGETIDLVGPDRDLDLAPGEVEVGMVVLLLADKAAEPDFR